ncbi:MAG: YtxH domain-containing protein [Thermodesulfovibrionales bacterium]
MRNDEVTKVAGAFLIGGILGAAVALLYAPQSGQATRKDITRTARRVRNEIGDIVEDTIDSVHDFADDVKDKASDLIDSGVDLSEKAKKEIAAALEHGQKTVEKQRKRLSEALGI